MRYVLAIIAMALIAVGLVFIGGPESADWLVGLGLVFTGALLAFGAASAADLDD